MARVESLVTAYILDGQGGGKKIGWEEIEKWTPEQGVLWVHLNYSLRRSKKWLAQQSGLEKFISKAMSIEESRPRSVLTQNGLLVFLRGVNLNPGQYPEDMVSIRTWIDENRIITTRKRKLLSIADIEQTIIDEAGPKSPDEFLCLLSDRLLDRMSDVIENVGDAVDSLEEEVISAESRLLRPKISDIRRQSILIRRYLAPQREALNRLYFEKNKFVNEASRIHLREASDRVIRYIEDLDSTRDRASISQEELASRIQEQMDSRMYVLSVVAVIFLPLSFITGLLGINVGGIPGAEHQWGFVVVCLMLVFILMLMLWEFHRKKWI